MPLFLDRHRGGTTPTDTLVNVVTSDLPMNPTVDRVQTLGHWAGTGGLYWLIEAPDVVAAARYHTERQLTNCDLRPISLGVGAAGESLTREQSLRISNLIRELWG